MTTLDDLFDAARADVDDGGVPACQLAIAREGEIVAFETFGDATDETRFKIFSATKPIVASAVWFLIAEGKLDVSRPVAEYVPEFAANSKDSVTVEQVMLHTAGFPNAAIDAVEGADPVRRVERFGKWELEWEPGSRFEYHATSAHWVLAQLIERLSGDDFRDYVEQRVCRPLGLARVLGLRLHEQRDIAPLVAMEPSAADDNLFTMNQPEVIEAGVPGGGAVMTAADLARFYQALLHNRAGVWDEAVLADAKTNIRCRFDDPLMGVAANRTLGLVLAGDDGLHELRYAVFGHDCSPGSFGHAGAFGQVGWADPATGVSFAYVSNAARVDQLSIGIRCNRLATIAAALTF